MYYVFKMTIGNSIHQLFEIDSTLFFGKSLFGFK
jgi:hypothetical protein